MLCLCHQSSTINKQYCYDYMNLKHFKICKIILYKNYIKVLPRLVWVGVQIINQTLSF